MFGAFVRSHNNSELTNRGDWKRYRRLRSALHTFCPPGLPSAKEKSTHRIGRNIGARVNDEEKNAGCVKRTRAFKRHANSN